jgi:TfoX/Sxy family transcriptional regulator of competence genes
MAYNEKLAEKVREALSGIRNVQEKRMFGGIAFMVNDKMCVGVDKEDLMLRCEPEQTGELLAKKGVRIFNLTGKPLKGWLLIGPEAISGKKNLDYWINLAIESNSRVNASKKSKSK